MCIPIETILNMGFCILFGFALGWIFIGLLK